MDQINPLEQALRIALRRESPSSDFVQRVEFRLASQTAGGASVVWQPDPLRVPSVSAAKPVRAWLKFTSALRDWFADAKSNDLSVPAPQLFRGLAPVRRSPASIAFSTAAHVFAIAVIAFFVWSARLHIRTLTPTQSTAVDVRSWLPMTPQQKRAMGGGGGGGDHDLVDVSKGRLPRLDQQQITPPQIVRNDDPKLAVEPSIVMPRNIQLPNADMPNLGLPSSTQVQMASNGSGDGAGMGSGHNGGIGIGIGIGGGYGPGSGGGFGGAVYHVGGGVSAPIVLSAVDPEYSDEARRSKYTGIVVVALVVDAQGLPRNVHVIRSLGMGLNEKAIEAVKQYRFKAAEYQGRPVPVEVNIEVNFQIY